MGNQRWYDKDKRLARQLDAFMKVHPRYSYTIVQGLLDLIKAAQPDILQRFTIPSDVEQWCRRWYDKDPVFWIVLNGLKYANEELLRRVASYLEEQMAVPLPAKLGRLKPRLREARVGRNPRTGDDVDIAAHIAVKFQPSKSLRERLKKE